MRDDAKSLSFVSLEELTTPANGSEVMINHYWTVHPTKGAVFYRKYSPQCNSNERISLHLSKMYPWAEVKLIPVAYIPRRHIPPQEY